MAGRVMAGEWIDLLKDALGLEFGAGPRVCALGTVDGGNRPRVRTVVLRGLEGVELRFASDVRSGKNAQLRENRYAEACFYLPTLRQQFRVSGKATVSEAEEGRPEVLEVWQGLSEAGRAMFEWPGPGGEVAADAARAAAGVGGDAGAMSENFSVICLRAEVVDHLDLNFLPHRRRIWRAETDWAGEWVNP